MNPKSIQFQYDINRMDAVNLVATIHIDDYDTRFLEVLLYERGGAFDVSGSTAAARFVTLAGELLNDSVPCTVEGNAVTVPVDASAVKSQACTLKIEINLTKDGKVLTLPFPLWIRVRGSILDDAHITPESEGTIADLLKAAQEALDAAAAALEEAGNYENLDNKPQINGHTLSGDKTSSELGLQDKLTAGENVTIDENGEISAEGGTDDYNDLDNKPQIEGTTLSGNKTAAELGLQKAISTPDNYLQIYANGQLAFSSGLVIKNSSIISAERWFSGAMQVVNTQYDLSYYQQYLPQNCGFGLYIRMGTTPVSEYYFADSGKIYVQTAEHQGSWIVSGWREVGGGSQIVSGVVNQNGTITFTDSNGNVVITSGEKLVTSSNQQISMGYDNGGFYFLFDDGQEAVNNGSN